MCILQERRLRNVNTIIANVFCHSMQTKTRKCCLLASFAIRRRYPICAMWMCSVQCAPTADTCISSSSWREHLFFFFVFSFFLDVICAYEIFGVFWDFLLIRVHRVYIVAYWTELCANDNFKFLFAGRIFNDATIIWTNGRRQTTDTQTRKMTKALNQNRIYFAYFSWCFFVTRNVEWMKTERNIKLSTL